MIVFTSHTQHRTQQVDIEATDAEHKFHIDSTHGYKGRHHAT